MEIPKESSSKGGWTYADGYGAGLEIQSRRESQGGQAWTTTDECYNSVANGKRPNLEGAWGGDVTTDEVRRAESWPPKNAPWEGNKKETLLRKSAQRRKTRELGARFHSSLSHRLDPDEMPLSWLDSPPVKGTKPRFKMGEFSCYDCMKPIRTKKQLCNHLYGRNHLNVVGYRERTEEGYVPDRGRSPRGVALPSRRHEQETRNMNDIIEPDGVRNAGYHEWFDQCAFQDDQGRLVSSHPSPPSRAHHQGHPTSREPRERYVLHRTLRINDYCGPGPDCDSSNYEQEPPDDPCMGMYSPTIPDHELGSIASLIRGEGKVLHEFPEEYPIELGLLKDG